MKHTSAPKAKIRRVATVFLMAFQLLYVQARFFLLNALLLQYDQSMNTKRNAI
jgi:hypothetical protein